MTNKLIRIFFFYISCFGGFMVYLKYSSAFTHTHTQAENIIHLVSHKHSFSRKYEKIELHLKLYLIMLYNFVNTSS